ncbi:hypothetical protein C427_0614 [Paraglaciecola psychrophila 170]|uniref:Uncharacterized protein n=1 Tax=Paraglaciecola psychrophila 170 TaxID=1129794 RepID=K7AE88_9ALTE|nr:hypothetical protein C427_0614 [Paraglaciecola psychrophila 170]GAC38958.1 hypothetical protein GPSY_3347 [Paraglaciecola psychrophila 170]
MLVYQIIQPASRYAAANKQIRADSQTARSTYSKRYKSQGGLEWIHAL